MEELNSSDYRPFTQSDFEYEKKKAQEPIYFVYPNYVQKLKEHRIPLSSDMQDTELTRFIISADPKTIQKKIPTIVRLRHVNQEEPNAGKKIEYMIWYENWKGKDKNGHKIAPVSDLPRGIDKGADFSRKTDAEGVDHFTQEESYWLYTVPFSGEQLDKILEETNTDAESVQYIVMGIRSWGGFSYDEFRNLSFEEICERGRTGRVQQPVILGDNPDGRETVNKKPVKK